MGPKRSRPVAEELNSEKSMKMEMSDRVGRDCVVAREEETVALRNRPAFDDAVHASLLSRESGESV